MLGQPRPRLIAAGIVFIVGAVALVGVLLMTTPGVGSLAATNPSTTSFIERARTAGRPVSWEPVPLERVSPDLVLAILVGEDIRFFDHHGFDRVEILNAVREALTGKRLRGASTITQQLARNLWLSRRRTPGRKIEEAILTVRLEHALTKRRILELYLNTAIFGASTVGVEAAARRYYGVSAADLTREQAARLAATLPAPEHWGPGSRSPKAERHFRRILERMDWPLGLRERVRKLTVEARLQTSPPHRPMVP